MNELLTSHGVRGFEADLVLAEAARVCRVRGHSLEPTAGGLWARARGAERRGWRQSAAAYRMKATALDPQLTMCVRGDDAQAPPEHQDVAASLEAVSRLTAAGCHGEDLTEAIVALGRALLKANRRDEAAEALTRALALKPTSLRSLMGLAHIAAEVGRNEESVDLFRRVLAVDPEQTRAHRALGFALKVVGDLQGGFEADEWHYPPDGKYWQDFEQPLWTRTRQDGKTVLIWMHGGLGDAIQMLRYLPRVKACGGRLLLQAPRTLVPLLEQIHVADEVVTLGGLLPAFDVHERLARLPLIFGTQLADIPDAVPYLSVERALVERWGRRLRHDGRFTVGLCWGGNLDHVYAATRFVPLRGFGPLGGCKNVRFVSLQMSPQVTELVAPPDGLRVECLLDDACSAADTAALMQHLDLVITVDTMVAHLAGALARPVWVVLPRVADWRWGQEGERTRWYATMRLFRQTHDGDWSEVFEGVHDALRDAADRRVSVPTGGS